MDLVLHKCKDNEKGKLNQVCYNNFIMKDIFGKALMDYQSGNYSEDIVTWTHISDEDVCEICKEVHRNKSIVCVVESVRDVMAIEETTQFNGLYHVLGGVISPMDGVGPGDLSISALESRVKTGEIKELIMAISPTIEGDTTIYYLSKQLEQYNVQISTIARGVSFGGELEYADELTLGRSIISRIPYSSEPH